MTHEENQQGWQFCQKIEKKKKESDECLEIWVHDIIVVVG